MGIAGYIRHIDRSADKMNSCEVQHSNPDINSDLTLENESYYKDSNGEWQRTSRSKDMENAINRRIEYAKEHGARISTKGKNDTVIVRPLVLQMGNDSITGHENTWMWDLIGILEKEFGTDNITGFSIHKDETNPHIHVCFVPCHESEKNGKLKCTISQTKFFHNPKQLAGLHNKFRKKLLDKGYDIELENKPIEEVLACYYDKDGKFHQQGLTPDMLKRLSNKEIQLRMEMIRMRIREEDLDILEKNIREMKEQEKAREEEMERRFEKERESLSTQQTALENDRATLQSKEYDLLIKEMKVQRMEENAENTKREAEEMFEKAASITEICNQILSEEKHLNAKFLEFLKREDERTGRHTHDAVVNWFKRFQNERKKKHTNGLSDLFDFDYKTKELLESGNRVRNERLRNRNSNADSTTDNSLNIIDIIGTNTDYDFSA
nr:plasmid recombination protein [Hominisplanchenecus murintestinalis]